MRRLPPAAPAVLIAAAVLAAAAPTARAARWEWSGSLAMSHKRLYPLDDAGTLAKVGTIVQMALKTSVQVSERVAFNARLCGSCHGLAIDQAYGEITLHPRLNLEVGRVTVPFGDFHQRHDPANDVFLSKPLPYEMGHMLRYQQDRFNLGVLPMPYADNGATLFGDVWVKEKLQVWYALYGVNGFRSGTPRDFTFKEQISDAGWNDNNGNVTWGGRLALAQGPVAAGASFLRGAYDPLAAYDYGVWGVDGAVYLGATKLRAEYLERWTEVLDDGGRRGLDKKGFYAQVETPLRREVTLVGRLDGLLREGPSLGTDNDTSSGIVRWSLGVNVAPAMEYAFRLQWEHWRFTDFGDADVVHAGTVVTF
jgi:hypothetical protein